MREACQKRKAKCVGATTIVEDTNWKGNEWHGFRLDIWWYHQRGIAQLPELSLEEEKMIKFGALHHVQCMEIGRSYVSKLG